MDIDFSENQEGNAISNKCDVKIRNHKDLIRNVTSRKQEYQKTNDSDTTEYQFSEHTKDLLSFLELLNNKYPYHHETNKNVLTDREIRLFAKLYGITDFSLIFVTCDASVFWLKDPDGIYFCLA
jgi:hypothetical protein